MDYDYDNELTTITLPPVNTHRTPEQVAEGKARQAQALAQAEAMADFMDGVRL